MELMPACRYCGCVLTFFEHYDCYNNADEALFLREGIAPNVGKNTVGQTFINFLTLRA